MARRDLRVSVMTGHVAALMLTAAVGVALPVTVERSAMDAWPVAWKVAFARGGGGDRGGGSESSGHGGGGGGGGSDDSNGGSSGDHGGGGGSGGGSQGGGGSDDHGGGSQGGGGSDDHGGSQGGGSEDHGGGSGSDDRGGGPGSDDGRQVDDRSGAAIGSDDRSNRRGRGGRPGTDDRPSATVRLSDDELADLLQGERVLVDDRGRVLEVDIELEQGRRTVTVRPHGGDAQRNPGPIGNVHLVATPPTATREVHIEPNGRTIEVEGPRSTASGVGGPRISEHTLMRELPQIGNDLSPEEEASLIEGGWR